MNPEKRISIIIPCYNEEETIPIIWSKIREVLSEVTWDAEIIFINDGSNDNTLKILKDIQGKNKNIKILSFTRNFGQQAALTAGLKQADGDAAIIIDADLQDPPELINKMVMEWIEGKGKIIIGRRTSRAQENFFKKYTSRLFNRIFNAISEISLPLNGGDFRLVDRQVIDYYINLPEHNKFNRGLFSWLGFKYKLLEYERLPRVAGATKYSIKKMMALGTCSFLSFSKKPLLIGLSVGIFSMAIALGLTLYTIISRLSSTLIAMPDWTWALIVIMFFNGIQFLILGIIGSYIGMIFDEVKRRPEYIVDEIIDSNNQSREFKKSVTF